MSSVEVNLSFPHGNRTLPGTLGFLATSFPNRLYASVARSTSLEDGFLDVTCQDMARCVDFMAHWITNKLGKSSHFDTLAYIGIPDLRSVAVFLGAVKCGYKVLLPSPRNPPPTNLSLMQQTRCSVLLHTVEVSPVVKLLVSNHESLCNLMIPSFEEMLESTSGSARFDRSYREVQDDPIVILHSSGSTGIAKPITMTHATFSVLDQERLLPTVPGRRNRDYSIWDFNGGGKFYTVFPYFHLAGFLSLVINPIFTESLSPILGPPLMPPSGLLLKEIMHHQNVRALYLPPSVAEQLLMEPGGLEFFRGLDFLCYTGGPFSPSAGERLSTVTELCPLYGSTEAFQVPQLAPAPEDWAWMEWNPHFKVEMQPSPDEAGTFELVLFADETTKKMSALNHNLPGTKEYRTKDLFKQHPSKPSLWQYYGRRDDIIVLSNGEKFNPVPMELKVQGHPSLAGALIIGQGRSRASLLLEPKPEVSLEVRNSLTEEMWPFINDANLLLPAQGRILRGNIIVSKPEIPFTRAGKGTVVRKLTEKAYQSDIDALYRNIPSTRPGQPSRLQATMKPYYEPGTVLDFLRGVIVSLFPGLSDVSENEDLFSAGLDSVMISQLISDLKTSVQESTQTSDLAWLDTNTVYRNSSLARLANVLSHFLNTGQAPTTASMQTRVDTMKALLLKYTEDFLPTLSRTTEPVDHSRCVTLIGSTGYLGPQILASLLAERRIKTIYCLNRGHDASERTKTAVKNAGCPIKEEFSRMQFLVSDLGSPKLGLSDDDFSEILKETDTIIYNAWKPDFGRPIASFEKPFLSGLRTIIDWASVSPVQTRIVFISSIAAVGNWSKVSPHETHIPEAQITDLNVTMQMGYGESKGVAECMLQAAYEKCQVPVDIVRTGQIGGPGRNTTAVWPVQGWLLALIRASKALGAFPTRVSPIDWVTVDALAHQISDVVMNRTSGTDYRVFNLVRPELKDWGFFLYTLSNRFELDLPHLTLPEWLDILAERSKDRTDTKQFNALKIAEFLRSLGNGMEGMRCVSENVKKVSEVELDPLTEDMLATWLADWKF